MTKLRWNYKGVDYETEVLEQACLMCNRHAVVALAGAALSEQTDGTTHVCHPMLGGCNQGFSKEPDVVIVAGEKSTRAFGAHVRKAWSAMQKRHTAMLEGRSR